LEEQDKLFITTYLEREVSISMGISLREIFKTAGPKIWKLIAGRTHSPMLKHLSLAMANMLQLQEKDQDTWLAMPIIGHSMLPAVYRITLAEGVMLTNLGYTHVAQLFGIHELTGKINKRSAAAMNNVGASIRIKCAALREQLSKLELSAEYMPGECILKTLDRVRWSHTYRKIHRNSVDKTMPGPPSYFTRQRDRIPVPSLKQYMKGYKKLFHLKLHSKTLENSYNIMNRQVWTNLKQCLSMGGAENENLAECQLCGQRENTNHLIFECENYSEKIWRALGDIVTTLENTRVEMHAFNVIYNQEFRCLSPLKNEQLLYLIQEIKRNLILRRYLRATTGPGLIHYNNQRILAHLLITLKKSIYQRSAEGYVHDYLILIQQSIVDAL
jgi:hypothetical protein